MSPAGNVEWFNVLFHKVNEAVCGIHSQRLLSKWRTAMSVFKARFYHFRTCIKSFLSPCQTACSLLQLIFRVLVTQAFHSLAKHFHSISVKIDERVLFTSNAICCMMRIIHTEIEAIQFYFYNLVHSDIFLSFYDFFTR